MGKLPRVRGREVIAALCKAGFTVIRIKGSHQVHHALHPIRKCDSHVELVLNAFFSLRWVDAKEWKTGS